MVNMSAKFDEEAHNSLVSIVFTSLNPYISIVTLTFDLRPPKLIGFILSSWLTCLPRLRRSIQSFSLYRFHKVHTWTHGRTHTHTEPQQCYYIPSATHCMGIKSISTGQTNRRTDRCESSWLVGCFEDLRRFSNFSAISQLEAGDNQSLKL